MFQHILLALDSGAPGSVATSFTTALAKRFHAAVHVVHVNEHLVGGRSIASEPPAKAAAVVADALREMHRAGVDATGATYCTGAFGHSSAICLLAIERRADAIVVGARRRRFGSFLRRSTREGIARHTSLPVLTAPAPLDFKRRGRTFGGIPSLPSPPVRS